MNTEKDQSMRLIILAAAIVITIIVAGTFLFVIVNAASSFLSIDGEATPIPMPTETPGTASAPTPAPTAAATMTPSAMTIATLVITPAPTATPTITLTPTATANATATPTATATATPTPTITPTPTATPFATSSPTGTATPFATPTPTGSATPTPNPFTTGTEHITPLKAEDAYKLQGTDMPVLRIGKGTIIPDETTFGQSYYYRGDTARLRITVINLNATIYHETVTISVSQKIAGAWVDYPLSYSTDLDLELKPYDQVVQDFYVPIPTVLSPGLYRLTIDLKDKTDGQLICGVIKEVNIF